MRLGWLVLCASCVGSRSTVCEDGTVCPSAFTCVATPAGTGCASDAQLAACDSGADGAPCSYGEPAIQGTCFGGVCLPSDGTCNNNVVDVLEGEQCDRADGIAHDGCSGTCLLEAPEWRRVSNDRIPLDGLALAYDSHRDRIVMFGGNQRTTWEWDGARWLAMSPTTSPPPRVQAGMAYDAARRRVVLFGGFSGNQTFDDTWEYDGLTWRAVSPAMSPRPRGQLAMAYDPVRARTVIFGGAERRLQASDATDEVWEWDGAAWTQRPVTGPSARAGATLTYDPRRGVMVMFGGRDGSNARRGDTWELTAAGWVERPSIVSPPARERATAAYDTATGRVLLHGGKVELDTTLADTWAWDGTAWTMLGAFDAAFDQGAASFPREGRVVRRVVRIDNGGETRLWDGGAWVPLARTGPLGRPTGGRTGMAFAVDPIGRRMLIAGGLVTGVMTADAFLWDGGVWQAAPANAPPARRGGAMAYDEARGEFVLFGGAAAGQLGDTWIYDGAAWAQRTPPVSPPSRTRAAMAYDPVRRVTVLYGGDTFPRDDRTWEWDGVAWSVSPAPPLPLLDGAAAAWDPNRNAVVMFGGIQPEAGNTYNEETFAYDGAAWRPLGLAGPPGREGSALAWNAPHRALLLYGGQISTLTTDDAWELGPDGWRQIAVSGPGPRAFHAMFPLFDGSGVGVFGGRNGAQEAGSTIDELLHLVSRSATLDETCGRFDVDGDGLVGCADPDCWPICAPGCPLQTSCASAHCGDGTCDEGRETCELCAADCGACAPACGDGSIDPGEDATTCPGDAG